MKKVFFLSILVIMCLVSFAQTPNAFKYQAILRDTDGKIIANEAIKLQISILQSSDNGDEVYIEEHSQTTNITGLIVLSIGEGSVISGDFNTINWAIDKYFIKIDLNRNNSGFVTMGTTPLLSVPYALHAKTADNVNDADADPTNEIQTISIDANTISLSNGGSVELPVANSFSGSYNDLNDVPVNMDTDSTDDFSGNYDDLNNKPTLGGDVTGELNAVTVQKIQGQNFSAGDPSTGQVLKWTGSAWAPGSDATVGGSGTDGVVESISVASQDNIKTITLGLSNSAPSSNLNANFTDDVNDADANPTNEIQTLSILGDTIALTQGGKVALPNKGWGELSDEALFAVVNTMGDTVFAVYDGGVRIYVDSSNTKARRGGFAVASTRPGKQGEMQEILTVTSDSVRIYLDESETKARRGGFAVASTRPGKKGIYQDIMTVTADSTRIYIADANAGFGVENTSSGNNERLMKLVEENYFIGHQAGSNNNTGMYNTFLGYQSGIKHKTGNNNIYIGYQSAFNDDSGQNNIFIGYKAGYSNLSGSENLFIGDSTGYNNTTGGGHVFMGYNAGLNNTTGTENTFVGYKSGKQNTTGNYNAFFGNKAGYSNVIGKYNAFFGSNAGYSVIGGTGLYTGSYNAFFGSYAGYNTTTGFANVFIGPYAGYENTTGRENVFVGLHAGRENTTGYYNTFVGKTCGYYNTTGSVSTFLGFDAGLHNTTGAGNTFLGASTGNFNTTGANNTFIGNSAGANAEAGSNNVYIGAGAGIEATGSNNVFIGLYAGKSTSISNSLFIDNSETSTPLIYGNFTDGSEQVEINGNFVVKEDFWVEGHAGGATTWNEPSDERLKKNITTLPNALNRVKQLRGVNFEWKDKLHPESGRIKMGFIAQEAIKVIPEAVLKNGEYYSMQYASITAIIVEAMKEQQQIIEQQQKENQELKDKYSKLEERLQAIENKLK